MGSVGSVGRAVGCENYGAAISAFPALPDLMLDPFLHVTPDASRLLDMAALFGERWPLLRSTALAAAGHRCEVTGLDQSHLPLEVVPMCPYNPVAKAVQLTRLLVVCRPLAEAKARLEQRLAQEVGRSAEEAAAAVRELQDSPEGKLLAQMNNVAHAEEVGQYFELVRCGAQTALEQGWKAEVLL